MRITMRCIEHVPVLIRFHATNLPPNHSATPAVIPTSTPKNLPASTPNPPKQQPKSPPSIPMASPAPMQAMRRARACWLRSGEGPAGLYLNLRNAPGKSGGLFLQHFLYHGSKLRENNRNCFPDQLIIGGKIRMRKLVPHTGDLTPRNFRVVVGNCLRQHFDRFTNYQEIIDDCIRCFFIGHEYL